MVVGVARPASWTSFLWVEDIERCTRQQVDHRSTNDDDSVALKATVVVGDVDARSETEVAC